MSLTVGTRLGPHEILGPLGAGGMGEVYRARDTRLDRIVAIKVLPERVAADPEALARFEREAKAVAALSHPNILAIHDFGSSDGTAYAVMELLEGETLRQRLAGGPLPAHKAIEQATQIARGLAAAHDRGVVHRDLKPDNVFVTRDGHVKILDFGLAAQRGAESHRSGTEDSPTLSRQTSPGTVMGTAGYMSPEQVRGQSVDHRSDIFSFGCVLYEMLAGRRCFQRDTAAETMTAILKEDSPELPTAVGAALPSADRLLRHCLEKRPEERFQSARDLTFDLQAIDEGSSLRAAGQRGGSRLVWAPAVLVVGLALGAALALRFAPDEAQEPAKLRAFTFSGEDGEPSASPDGRLVAFRSRRDGKSRIWIKQVRGGEAPLTQGEDQRPRFSPDGSSVLFLRAEGQRQSVYRVALVGGEPRKLIEDVREADWSPDGQRVVFVRRNVGDRERVSTLRIADLRDGTEQELLAVTEQQLVQPRFSPDGSSVAVIQGSVVGTSYQYQLLLVDVATRHARAVTPRGYQLACLAWSDHGIVLARPSSVGGDLSGMPARVFTLDLMSGKERSLFWTTGLFPITGLTGSGAACDIVSDGQLVFDSVQSSINLREVDLTAGGGEQARTLTQGSSRDRQPAYSPDGQRVVFSSNRSGNLDLWSLDRRIGLLRQLTDDPAQDWDPGFTPDGRNLLWSSDRSGNLEIWIAGADGSGARQLTRNTGSAENPTATPDGAWIVYTSAKAEQNGIWKIRADGSEPRILAAGPYTNAEVSPDGRYTAFLELERFSSETPIRFVETVSGVPVPFEIHVAYPPGHTSILAWGRMRWAPDGRHVIFVGADAAGNSGVFIQDFTPGRDSAATRRPLAGFSRDYTTESHGLSRDGRHLTIATLRSFASLWLADALAGVKPPAHKMAR